MTKRLNFIIIGAAKSGTTSLHNYLRLHPQLYLPALKEVPFFTKDDFGSEHFGAFAQRHFADAKPEQLWGKATPHYMEDGRIPERIVDHNPDAKLIAILRHPVERVISYHRMQERLRGEAWGLDEAVAMQLDDAHLAHARSQPFDPKYNMECNVARSEYGRILSGYLDHFPKEQLLVLFTSQLKNAPEKTLRRVFDFLGVEAGFVPPNLDERYNVGGRDRFPDLLRAVKQVPGLRALWRVLPRERRLSFYHWFKYKANRIPEAPPDLVPSLRDALIALYRDDVDRLERILGREVPWRDFSSIQERA